jgi:hypothetical protein
MPRQAGVTESRQQGSRGTTIVCNCLQAQAKGAQLPCVGDAETQWQAASHSLRHHRDTTLLVVIVSTHPSAVKKKKQLHYIHLQ